MPHQTLLTPGPVPISEDVKKELSRDMVHHRTGEIKEALGEIQPQLQQIFKTKEHVHILHSTGTGAMEASITNTLSPQDEVIVISGGKFGERWKKIAETYQLIVHEILVPWGHSISADQVEKELKKYPKSKAILMQCCETSTATLFPVKEIAQITKKQSGVLLIVDAISSVLIHDLLMDEWGVDVVLGGSQKSFALPAGFSFIALSKKAQKFQSTSTLPCFYFDLSKEKKANIIGQTSYTSNVSFIRALRTQLNDYTKIGLPHVQRKSVEHARITHQLVKDLGLSLFSKKPSSSVTAILLPSDIDGKQVKNFMLEKNVFIGGGQDQLEGKIVRFGHMGEITNQSLLLGFKVFCQSLKEQKPSTYTSALIEKALTRAEKSLAEKSLRNSNA